MQNNEGIIQDVYHRTDVLRRPISGIVSGYHELPYILVTPDEEDESQSIQVNGKVKVSPRFVISPSMLGESFGEVFDPETFDKGLQGRLFSFLYLRKKSFKLESEKFEIQNISERAHPHLERVQDELMRQENVSTALIFGPRFDYYPVSIDRFVNEVLDREFRV